MHYFSPVPRMPLLEIITTEKTSKDVLETALAFGREQGKKCIVVRDGPGFYTTRILVAMLNQAARLIDQGGDLYEIDDALAAFGFPVGPVTLLDEIGIDTGSHVGEMMKEVWEPKGMEMSPLFTKMYEKGLFGRKSGAGFYRYDVPKEGDRKAINREALESLGVESKGSFTAEELQDRLVLAMVNEAARCLEEGILSSPEDGDRGAILGLGFPMDKGGPFHYMDSLGMKELVERLEATRKQGGEAYAPAGILRDMAQKGTTFYS
jgi:3-hydroxyacyl-CoA dehydrogenase/enoyl-CoA hydratase/3-hydroxybutyryl-CoA epimerase